MWSIRSYCQILMKLDFSQQIFRTFTSIKFHENPSSGSRVVPCGRTDERTWHSYGSNVMVSFRNLAKTRKNSSVDSQTAVIKTRSILADCNYQCYEHDCVLLFYT